MLSRLALRKCLQLKPLAPTFVGSVRLTSTTTKEGPERDLVNFPRPVRSELPAKVRYATIPEEWFEFFYKKTGVTGPYMLGLGLWTYVLSKEIWVIEHDYFFVYSFFITCYLGYWKFGKQLAGALDKDVDSVADAWKESREVKVKTLEEAVAGEQEAQWQAEGQHLLLDAKRENVKMQLEASYRERAMQVYSEVKKRLDYQVEKQRIEQTIAQKHMVQWVVNNVLKSISAQQEKETLKKCMSDLQALAVRA
uniref:ATP synthase subunit b n=1 Tax=Panstrongylus megistus TaxID=65343 RepID=A0A069DY00_9HEMI